MKLLNLECHNVFSIGDASINLADRGLTLVTGFSHDDGSSNGSGKTSLCNKSILWGLYGKTASKDGADDVINRHSEGSSGVMLNFIGIDGKPYAIHRQRNPNKLELINAGTDLTRKKESDTQELINGVLGREWKTFLYADFFGQGRKDSFLELRGQEQKEIIEEILPLDKLSEWHINSKSALKKVTEAVGSITSKLNDINTRKNTLTDQLDLNTTREQQWKTSHSLSLYAVEGKISTLRSDIKEKEDQLDNTLGKAAWLIPLCFNFNLDKDRKELKSLNIKFENTSKIIDKLNKKLLPKHKELKDIKESLYEKVCSLCGQELHSTLLTKAKKGELIDEIERLAKTIGIHQQNAEDLLTEMRLKSLFIFSVEGNKKILNELLKQGAQELKIIKVMENDNLHLRLEELKKEKNPYTPIVTSLKISIDDLDKENGIATAHLKKLELDRKWIAFWENAFSKDIRNILFEKVCPFLEEKTNSYLGDLNNGQLQTHFDTSKQLKSGDIREDFTVTVQSMSGGVKYSLLSGGEQQLVSFAINLALADLAESQVEGNSQILILDEPFHDLSPQNCENLIDFLTQKLNKRKSTIFLVSNEDALKNLVPGRIHIEKRNGISSIVGV